MRSALLLFAASLFSLATPVAASHAQVFASNGTPVTTERTTRTTPDAETPTGKVVLVGKITNPNGPLPGAVVILTATKQMAVTNADGEFQFVVPADAGALQALVTYAGYADEPMVLNASADESTVSLTNARVITVARRQQLKFYLKHARKEANRSLRQLHR